MKPDCCESPFRWLRNHVPSLVTAGLDRGWWARGEHKLDGVVGRLSIKAHCTDLCDLAQGHRGQIYTEIDDELTHIRWEIPRRLLRLRAGFGSKETEHPLLVKGIGL